MGVRRGGQAQQVVDWMVELMDAVSAVMVSLRTFLSSCGKFTQLNLFFQGVRAEIACSLPCFCSEYHQRAIFITASLEISIQKASERATARLYI